MFIEIIDLLRCTRPHEDSWLVATFHQLGNRRVGEGLLSCPVCGARYPVADGVAHFGDAPASRADAPLMAGEEAMRAAAYLNLIEPGVVLLHGAWAVASRGIAELGNIVIALDAPGTDDFASHIISNGTVPLASECVDGVALGSAEQNIVASAVKTLKTGARIVAPAAAQLPGFVTELARDERWVVAQRKGSRASAPVQIARR